MGSTHTYDVYGIGNALVDMVCRVDDWFVQEMGIKKGFMTLIDKETHDRLLSHVTVEKREGGGSAANTMIALSHFGGRGFYSCKVADDDGGRFYLDELFRAGLRANLEPGSLDQGITGKCMVLVTPDAERTMTTYLGATETFSVDELDEEALARSRYLYIEGYLVAQETGKWAAIEAVRIARRHGVKTSLTFSDPTMVTHFRRGIDEIIGDGIDLIFCNDKEACAYAQTEDLARACDRLKAVAKSYVITRGECDTLVWDGDRFIEIPAHRVDAIDTVGAGDMFAGTYLYGITHGYSCDEAARLANHAASRVVTKYGPRLSSDEIRGVLSEFHAQSKGA